jgi:glycosyltransferase involved in cell wall biosynthesis
MNDRPASIASRPGNVNDDQSQPLQRRILFVSALDYKRRSIQVNRLTPEHYARNGWHVDALVCRDTSKVGDYYYEPLVNPDGVTVHRLDMRLSRAAEHLPAAAARILRKADVALNVLRLGIAGRRMHRAQPYDVIYGYEVQGALASLLIHDRFIDSRTRVVTRFQGSHLYQYFRERRWLALLRKAEHLLALLTPADLTIMTNDGTMGDRLLELLRVSPRRDVRFWVNGVDEARTHSSDSFSTDSLRSLSISRLISWKRIDRVLEIIASLQRLRPSLDIDHLIVGEGIERSRLERLAERLGVAGAVRFAGALDHGDALKAFADRSVFFSMYDSSNVGNPLLEAIRHHCYVFTLANGDTSRWIRHNVNGFAYDPKRFDPEVVARDVLRLLDDTRLRQGIRMAIAETDADRLWTWERRLDAELGAVEGLLLKSDARRR